MYKLLASLVYDHKSHLFSDASRYCEQSNSIPAICLTN